ncbi:MAG: chemotaxis response regulator protein-glutamate methylesterase [Isosphaeraceae bacterium]
MRKIRVLIVDDSVVIRRVLSDVVSSDPALEVAGIAQDGRIALGKVASLHPDVVILDVEMPNLDGMGALAEIRKNWPLLPVIMYSNMTQRGAIATLDALALGASDYQTKPAGSEGPEDAVRRIREELIPRIKAFCRGVGQRAPEPTRGPGPWIPTHTPSAPRRVSTPTTRRAPSPINLVAIGTSTGGPNALGEILPAFPANFPPPIVIVQHMPPIFTRMLAERLASRSSIEVTEAVHGEPLRPGHAYVAPGGRHMVVEEGDGDGARLLLNDDPRENSCRPAADVLFRSAAAAFPGATLAVILTGLGSDGLKGCEAVVNSGGLVFAQDEPTSVVWGMPGSVVKAGLADRVIPLDLIGDTIVNRVLASREPVTAANR